MRRFAYHDDEPARRGPDAVLLATRELVAAAAALRADPMRYAEALRAFRAAVRRRFDREVALGLPPDVVGHVMRCAIRMAVEAAPPAAARRLIVEIGAVTLSRAESGLRDDVLG